jgi:hypothetical protein
VKLSYVDQSRDALDADKTVWEEISGGAEIIELGDASMNSRAYCGAFNFKGGDQQKKVGLLSGGERNRVHMAKLLKSGGNVLLLDEPTNDLDVETLRALEDALEDFAGCAVIISTTGSSSTGSARISSPSRARRMWNGSRATSRITRKTRSGAGTGRAGAEAGEVQEVREVTPLHRIPFSPISPCDRYRTRYPVSSTRTSASICYTDATPPQSRGRTPD